MSAIAISAAFNPQYETDRTKFPQRLRTALTASVGLPNIRRNLNLLSK